MIEVRCANCGRVANVPSTPFLCACGQLVRNGVPTSASQVGFVLPERPAIAKFNPDNFGTAAADCKRPCCP